MLTIISYGMSEYKFLWKQVLLFKTLWFFFNIMHVCFRKCRIGHVRDTYKAALCVGCQPKSDVWVFGPNLQISGDGSITNPDTSGILWVQDVIDLEDGRRKTVTEYTGLPNVRLPLYGYAIRDVIKALINTVHDNTMAGIFTIGMSVLI